MSPWKRNYSVSIASVMSAIIAAASAYFGCKNGFVRTPTETRNEIAKEPCIQVFQYFLEDPMQINASDRALSLVQDTYHKGYYNSSISHHYFVRTAPATIQDTISEFVWSNSALKEVRGRLEIAINDGASSNNEGIKVIPDVFDEIYLMRPEFDLVDEKKIHYDGNLKIPGICTIRALTYLSGKDALLFALTSQKNFTTQSHSSVVLDFDREMHYVSLNVSTATKFEQKELQILEPRVMIKSALHVVLPGTQPAIAYLRIVLHRIMVFGARTFRRAFESKSQPQSAAPSRSHLLMVIIDNLMRSMNKIHMALPLIIVGLPLVAFFLAPILYPFQFSPYVAQIIARCTLHTDTIAQPCIRCLPVLLACAAVGMSISGSSMVAKVRRERLCLMLFHLAWVGFCFYVEANIVMINEILLAPWQQVTHLNDIV